MFSLHPYESLLYVSHGREKEIFPPPTKNCQFQSKRRKQPSSKTLTKTIDHYELLFDSCNCTGYYILYITIPAIFVRRRTAGRDRAFDRDDWRRNRSRGRETISGRRSLEARVARASDAANRCRRVGVLICSGSWPASIESLRESKSSRARRHPAGD